MKRTKILSGIIAICMAFTVFSPFADAYDDKGYADVTSSDWFYNSVQFVTEKNIMTGVSETEFAPTDLLTRAMFVTALYRLDGEPELTNDIYFSDVEKNSYYEKAVAWANGNSIASGISDTEFAPNSLISREQMAKIIYNYSQYKQAYTGITADMSEYTDFEQETSDYAVDAVKYCIGEGILTGKSDSVIAPKDNATRAEAAAIIERVYALLEKDNDIVILFTNDVHAGINDNFGFAGVKAYKKRAEQTNEYVTLIDCGDAIQGDILATFSKGEYIIDIMNNVGYDFAVLGNHEFEYGMEQLAKLIDKSNAQYINGNIKYTGSKVNLLQNTIPYTVKEYGEKKIGYVGVTTPYTITLSTPKYFKEDNEFVYDFSINTDDEFYNTVQTGIDKCKNEGADIVVVLSHCGDGDEDEKDYKYSSIDLINHIHDADVVLDAHAHHIIESKKVQDENGKDVILTSAGTRLEKIGQLVIKDDNTLETSLISDYKGKDIETSNFIKALQSDFEDEINVTIGTSSTSLSIYDDEGIRMSRNREIPIGNLCADAIRTVFGTDIAFINGGGIRDNLEAGEITLADIIKVQPFSNEMCVIKTSGQKIADALEWATKEVTKEYKANGNALGENGGFYHASGIKFTIDTSIDCTVSADENNMFTGITGPRRVGDIMVMNNNGEYEPLDLNKEYTIAASSYVLLDNGDGQTAFDGAEVVIGGGMIDIEVLINYIVDYLHFDFEKYSEIEGRIIIK